MGKKTQTYLKRRKFVQTYQSKQVVATNNPSIKKVNNAQLLIKQISDENTDEKSDIERT